MMTKIVRLAGLCLCLGGAVQAGANEQPAETFQMVPDRPADLKNEKNLYTVGYAHLDTQWRWTYPQVIREFIANTLHDNFALLDKYPNYLFNFSGSRRYEMMQEYFPAEFEKLKEYVKAGRWFPAGSSVDEADAIVPNAESFLRQILYGNNYFRREFGIASDEFMLPDCFGFPQGLPSLLAHAGIKGFSTQKLTWGSAVGKPFKVGVWEGPDGRSVVAALDPGAYTSPVKEDLSKSESWLTRINNTGATSGAYVDYRYYGAPGDRGGAPLEDSVRWVQRAVEAGGPVRVISAKADRMFKELQPEQVAKLPRYKGELLLTGHSAGSITSQSYMKRWNRKNELLADSAERASVAALWLGGAPYPAKKLYDGWDLVLGAQMHDMLPGTSLPKAYEFCWNDEILAANQFAAALEHGVGVVAAALDTQAGGVPLVVYNALSVAREDVVEAAVTFPNTAPTAVAVFGPDGRELPAQVLRREGNTLTVAFVASVPSVGFAVFDVRPAAAGPAAAGPLQVSTTGLENERYRVAVGADGDVSSIYDKVAKRELLSAPARLSFHFEKSIEYPAWNMEWSDRQKPARAHVEGPATFRIVESGPVRVALEIERESQGSRFVQTVRLAAGGAGDRVEFATQIDWHTRQSSLKAAFPLTVSNPIASYDSQVGTLQRANNDPKKYEVPQHQWFDLTATDGSHGVAVLNDSKYGSDKPSDNTMRLTLLFTPDASWRFQDQATQDFGRHQMLYAVASHEGDWRAGRVPATAARLNQPLIAFQAPAHPGALGRSLSLFTVSGGGNVVISAVKKAELSDEIVVRFQEVTGVPAVGVRLSAATAIAAARELDAQERGIGEARLDNGEVAFDMPGYGLKTLGLKLSAAAARVAAPVSRAVSLPFNEDVVSSNASKSDGRFDAEGRAFPAEQLPAKITSEGVEFVTGPTADGKLNAVAARGQSIALPAGEFTRVYLLAAADGDAPGRFLVDGRPVDLKIQNWTGYIGQWDNRLWKGEVLELTYFWFNDYVGLEPGFTKRDPVAWYASHRHTPKGDDHYIYSYLFKYRIDVPVGAKTLTLPSNPKIRVFAVSVAGNTHDEVVAAAPLYDTLSDSEQLPPKLTPAGGSFKDATQVTITAPLYWRTGGLRYTLDGSTPTPASLVYTGPITVNRSVTITACEFDAAGRPSPVAVARYTLNDTTAPRVVATFASSTKPAVRLDFSEPVEKASAETMAHYQFGSGVSVLSAALAADGMSVTLALAEPITRDAQLTVNGVRDGSPARNIVANQVVAVDVAKPVFRHAGVAAGESAEVKAPQLPVGRRQPWTMNLFVRANGPVDNRTVIAGFGRMDNTVDRTGRYFAKFANGVHLWMSLKSDLESTSPLDWNKWHMLSAVYDGSILRLFVDGEQVSWMELSLNEDEPVVRLAPLDPWDQERRFNGEVRQVEIWDRALSAGALQMLSAGRELK